MKHLKLFESFNESEIHDICYTYLIERYSINTDESIDCYQNVNLRKSGLFKIPLNFNMVDGWFSCAENRLKSLEGSPKQLNGGFYCGSNKLTSFQYTPKIIRGYFYCQDNNIKTFEYFPNFIKYDFECDGNPIEEVWKLFHDTTKIELLNDFDIFRDEDTDVPVIIMDRLNDFLLTIDRNPVKSVDQYKNI